MAKQLISLLLLLVSALAVQANDEGIEQSEVPMDIEIEKLSPLEVYIETNDTEAIFGRGGSRIAGGKPAFRGQFPWQAALIIDGNMFCGGSVQGQYILTAASCVYRARTVMVYLAAHNISQPNELARQTIPAISWKIHWQFDPTTRNNDIAVVKMSKFYDTSNYLYTGYIASSRLVDSTAGDLLNTRAIISGWGKTYEYSPYKLSSILNYVEMPVISNAECAKTYGTNITPTKMCTSTYNGASFCSGDIGSPLVYHDRATNLWMQIGISSFYSSKGCAAGLPAVYTRISSYYNFIRSVMV